VFIIDYSVVNADFGQELEPLSKDCGTLSTIKNKQVLTIKERFCGDNEFIKW